MRNMTPRSISRVPSPLWNCIDVDEFEDQYYLLSELDAIREILFMLSGLDCVLFTVTNTSITVFTLQGVKS